MGCSSWHGIQPRQPLFAMDRHAGPSIWDIHGDSPALASAHATKRVESTEVPHGTIRHNR
jgi:hypothetical protein